MTARPTPRLSLASITVVALLLPLAGCASVPGGTVKNSPAARELLQAAAEAHGKSSYDELTDIGVSYDGQWLSNVGRFQRVLVDERYRKSSQERIILADRLTGQTHTGPGGTKYVLRDREAIRVWYDGMENTDPEVLDAAAAVADAYEMFLLAPFVLLADARSVSPMPPTKIDGHPCEQVLVVLRPGLGRSAEDRVIVAIDRQTRLVRRVRFTFRGLKDTRNVLADVTYNDWQTIHGVVWPTAFYEKVQRPIRIAAHRWRLTGLDVNRGLTPADLAGPVFSEKAAPPAKALPAAAVEPE